MTARTDVAGGLRVGKTHYSAWQVTHEASGREVAGYLRLRRFAEQARAELLATSTDFTGSQPEVAADARWFPVAALWRHRVRRPDTVHGMDPDTFEHYSHAVRYGDVIPSEAHAAELRAAWAAAVLS